ncbi:MAG: carboxypeptidase-like regulatory domain-containing protein, partial [Vicinamibacterales bacterium]
MQTRLHHRFAHTLVAALACLVAVAVPTAHAQELGGAGTVEGTITDTTGGAMQAVTVTLSNPVTQFTRNVTTDTAGKFVIHNIPPNPYQLSVKAQGFKTYQHDLDIRSAVPIDLTIKLEVGLSEAV